MVVVCLILRHCKERKKRRSINNGARTPSHRRPRLVPTTTAAPAPSVTLSSRTPKSPIYQPTLPTAPVGQGHYELQPVHRESHFTLPTAPVGHEPQPVHRESHFTCQDLPPSYEVSLAYPPTAPADQVGTH